MLSCSKQPKWRQPKYAGECMRKIMSIFKGLNELFFLFHSFIWEFGPSLFSFVA